jgi:beta-lactamase regulating signal transducer with metallopeptidase domain/sugar lactone lactonase YvrE
MMNWPGLLNSCFAQICAPSPWALLMTKATLILAAAWLIYFTLAQTNPRWRALLWRAVVVGLVILAVWSIGLPGLNIRIAAPVPIAIKTAPAPPSNDIGNSIAVISPAELGTMAEPVAIDTETTAPLTEAAGRPKSVMPDRSHRQWLSWHIVLLGIWGLGVALLAIRVAIFYRRIARRLQTSQAVPTEIMAEVQRIAAAIGCHRAVQVRSSDQYAVPFLYGLRWPVLVLPERMCRPEYRLQLPGIIAHELAHVRSHDIYWNIALQAISSILWFYPLVWRIGSAHRSACDAVCDAISASYLGDVDAYCRTLARVALEGAASFPAAGLAMARSCDVQRRVAALKQKVFASTLRRRTVIIAALAGVLVSSLLACVRLMLAMPAAETAVSQNPAQPSTTETSIGLVLPLTPEKPTANNIASQNPVQPGTITTYVRPELPVDGAVATTQRIDYPSSIAVDGVGGFYVSSNTQRRIYHVAANGRIRLIAGYGSLGYNADRELPAIDPIYVGGLAADFAGNLYFTDTENHRIRKLTPDGAITTIAGNGKRGFSGDGGSATSALLKSPRSVAVDSAGNLYFGDEGNGRIRKVTPAGVITTFAGNGEAGFGGDGGPATLAQLYAPRSIAADSAGNIYIPDSSCIRKVTPDGVITTVAGKGRVIRGKLPPFSGEGDPAVLAQLSNPHGAAVDSAGNLYILDGACIRKVNKAGVITTVAGNEKQGFSGDGGKAISAQLAGPSGIAIDSAGNIYIADYKNHRVRKVTPDGAINTVAGNGIQVDEPESVAVDSAGNLYYSDVVNKCVRKVTPAGVTTTIARNETRGNSDGASQDLSDRRMPQGITVDSAGNVYIADEFNARVRKVTPDGVITTVAGNTSRQPLIVRPSATQLRSPLGIAVDSAGNLYISDVFNKRIHKVTPDGVITGIAGNGESGFGGDGGQAASALLNDPQSVAVDAAGNLYIADSRNDRIRKVTPDGIISTMAGSENPGYIGDGGPATSALLRYPRSVAVDSAGNLYIVSSRRVRKVTPDGIISNVAGIGMEGYSGDGGPATSARLSDPVAIAVDSVGNLYIADQACRCIRKVAAFQKLDQSGKIATRVSSDLRVNSPLATTQRIDSPTSAVPDGVGGFYVSSLYQNRIYHVTTDGRLRLAAGTGIAGYGGDGGQAASAQLYMPEGIAVDSAGNLFIADTVNDRIRKVTPAGIIATVAQLKAPPRVAVDSAGNLYIADYGHNSILKVMPDGVITTIAGNGEEGYNGDGGPAASARLARPHDAAVDSAGNLYIADTHNHRIRKVTPAGVITTAAGNGKLGFGGDGGKAASAQLCYPHGVAVDSAGNLYIADSGNKRIRKVTPAGVIATVAGNGKAGFSGDGGQAAYAQLNYPYGVSVDSVGNLYIADIENLRVRKVTPAGVITTVAGNGEGDSSLISEQ